MASVGLFAECLGFRPGGFKLRVPLKGSIRVLGLRVQGLGFRVEGSAFRVEGPGFRVEG